MGRAKIAVQASTIKNKFTELGATIRRLDD